MGHAVVIEKAEGNDSACVPDLPRFIATAASVEEVEQEIREAIAFHIEALREDGLAISGGSFAWADFRFGSASQSRLLARKQPGANIAPVGEARLFGWAREHGAGTSVPS